jgi:branched-chain amino acid transport system substrate-binding protein
LKTEDRNAAARSEVLRIWGLEFLSHFGTRVSTSCRLLLFGVLLLDASAAVPTNHNSAPFLSLRERTLEYTGPERDEADLQNIKEVSIGWFGPHDSTNRLGADMWWAASLAIKEANEQGGFKDLPFRLAPRWSVDPWGTGVSQLARMIYDERALALLGSIDSSSTHLAEQVVAKAQLPLVSPVTTDKSVTLAGVSWMFACAPTDDAIARVLVADVLGALQGTSNKLVLLSATDHESRMTAGEVLKAFSRQHHPPDFRFEVPPGARTFTNRMEAVEHARPGVVLIIARAEDAARLARAVRERIPACALFGNHSMGCSRFVELAGRSAEGVRFPLLFVPNPADPTTARFLDQFARQHQYPPDYTAALTYDATRLLLEAIRRGGLNRAHIREAIVHLSPWMGITGTIRWDGTGQNTRTNVGMGLIHNGLVRPIP